MASGTTKDTIVAQALERLGHTYVASLSGASDKHALTASRAYDEIVEELLYRHPWNFAVKRQLIVSPTTAPAFGFSYRFVLPNDLLRVLSIHQADALDDSWARYRWEIEAGHILCDVKENLALRYIYRNTTASTWSPAFVSLVIAAVAAEMAFKVTNSSSEADRRRSEYHERLHFATGVDESENPADNLLPSSDRVALVRGL